MTDKGLADFIEQLLLRPIPKYECVKQAFIASYNDTKVKNQFTKVQMNLDADNALQAFFVENQQDIESWFNIISPKENKLDDLKKQLYQLQSKNWQQIIGI